MKNKIWVLFALWGITSAGSAQEKFSLEEYLGRVKSHGPDFKSAQSASTGFEKQSRQQDLIYSPMLEASYGHLDDRQQYVIPFNGTRTEADAVSLTLSDKLPFGPTLSVGYGFDDITLTGSPFILAPYITAAPMASITLPLFKDFGGSQTRAGVQKVQYQLESASKGAAFQRGQALFEAKSAYWSLALLRAETVIRQDTLARSRKIWEWSKRRVARNLADPPDALQAEASVRVAELDLQATWERERTARLKFNRFRGVENDAVPELLEGLEDSLAGMSADLPAAPGGRLDLSAVEDQSKQQQAAYDEARQNIFPDLTAFASWTGNGLAGSLDAANQIAFQNDHPTYKLGAQLSVSLDVFTASRVSEGYKLAADSARLALEDKKIQVGQEWKDLRERLKDADKRLAMASQIEAIQKNKANQEKRRLELGRTTQLQLLSFENDYSLARLNRLSLVLEKLSLLAQAQWWLDSK